MQEKRLSISQPRSFGVGRIEGASYLPDYLGASQALALQQVMTGQVVWQQEEISMYGRTVRVPREVAWCGDAGVVYRYSGRDHTATGWLPELKSLAVDLGKLLNQRFNFALLNRYRTGRDYMGWHADNEPGVSGRIASISLGATRGFLMRHPDRDNSSSLQLEHGSLLVFEPEIRHCLPKRRSSDERFNITFRFIQPVNQRA